jgi:AcrR family transcriptional regulator
MARPVQADSAQTRRRVLASALAMFAEHGVDGVSIREIGSAAGVSLATVHHYFGSKEELYSACIDSMYAELVAMRPQLAAELGKGGKPAELIDRIVRAAFRFAREHQVEMRLLMRQVMAAGELDDARREVGQVPFLAEIPPVVAAITGRPADAMRLPLQTMSFLVSRYAISTERELELFTRKKGASAIAAAEEHLVSVAAALFQ